MDSQTLLNILLGSASTVLGWFARELWAAVSELRTDLAKLREELPTKYLLKSDFRDVLTELKTDFHASHAKLESMLHRIFERLDDKQDKP